MEPDSQWSPKYYKVEQEVKDLWHIWSISFAKSITNSQSKLWESHVISIKDRSASLTQFCAREADLCIDFTAESERGVIGGAREAREAMKSSERGREVMWFPSLSCLSRPREVWSEVRERPWNRLFHSRLLSHLSRAKEARVAVKSARLAWSERGVIRGAREADLSLIDYWLLMITWIHEPVRGWERRIFSERGRFCERGHEINKSCDWLLVIDWMKSINRPLSCCERGERGRFWQISNFWYHKHIWFILNHITLKQEIKDLWHIWSIWNLSIYQLC